MARASGVTGRATSPRRTGIGGDFIAPSERRGWAFCALGPLYVPGYFGAMAGSYTISGENDCNIPDRDSRTGPGNVLRAFRCDLIARRNPCKAGVCGEGLARSPYVCLLE
jgi:hypothetical protein